MHGNGGSATSALRSSRRRLSSSADPRIGGGGDGDGTPAPQHVHRGGSKPTLVHTSAPPQRAVSLNDLTNAEAYGAGRYFYVAQQVSRPGITVIDELTRVNPSALKVITSLRLGSMFQQALLAHGVLWVAGPARSA